MSILDSIKSAASDGLRLAGSAEKIAENGLGSLVSAGEKIVSTTAQLPALALQSTETQAKSLVSGLGTTLNSAVDIACSTFKSADSLTSAVTSFLPGVAEAKSLVAIGNNLVKSNTSGDLFKIQASASIASMIPGLGALVGTAAVASAMASETEPKKKDEIFNYVSTDEWKKILSEKSKESSPAATEAAPSKAPARSDAATSSSDKVVPRAHIDATGIEFERTGYDTALKSTDGKADALKAGQTRVEGDTAVHTEADGTVTTQTAGHTEIKHDGHTLIKDTKTGVVKDVVGDRVAYQQNAQNNTQEWNTKQGLRVVEENGEYKIFNKEGTLIGTRPVAVIASEVQEESQTLSNGEQMHRHLTGRMMDRVRAGLHHVPNSGKEWDVYSDGVSRTLQSGETVGMMASSDAFVQVGTTTVVRKAEDRKYYLIQNGGHSTEINIDSNDINGTVKKAVTMLRSIDSDHKMHLGDGTFLTVRDGKVVGGTDEIVDEPVPTPTGNEAQTAPVQRKKVEVTMVTTGKDVSTSTMLGGYQSTYNFDTHKSTVAEPTRAGSTVEPKPIVTIDDRSLTTDDVVTTKEGTTDRITHDVIGHDGSITTSNGIHVSANNDIAFADGVKFGHDGKVTLADGTVARAGKESNGDTVAQQASTAVSAAISIANAVAGKAASGTITFDDIALLQSSILDVQSLVGNCMAAGNLEVAQSLMKTGAGLESALDSANRSFAATNAARTLRSDLPSENMINQFAFLNQKRAA